MFFNFNLMFYKILFSLSVLSLLFTSCEKDLGTLGMGMLPSEDLLYLNQDSVSNIAYSYSLDKEVRTSQYNLMLGNYTDPVFGKVTAQLFLPMYFENKALDTTKQNTIKKIELLVIDSSFQYGLAGTQKVEIYEMKDTLGLLDIDSLSFNPSETLLGTFNLENSENDTSIYTFESSFVKKMQTFIDSKSYRNTEDIDSINYFFKSYMKGLHLKPLKTNGGIMKIKDIKMRITYNECSNDTCYESTMYLGLSSFYDYDFHYYVHPLCNFIVEHSKTITDSLNKPNQSKVYLQPMKGLKAEIKIPELNKWLDSSKIVINKAMLQIPIEANETYAPISSIKLRVIDNINEDTTYYTSTTVDEDYNYIFYLNSFVQKFLANQAKIENYKLELLAPTNNLYINRSVLIAPKTKFKLTYTKYK